MRVSLSGAEGLERKLTIEVPAAEVDSSVEARLRETARSVRLNGFRKGKVPLGIVKKRFGPGIRREVVGDLVSRSFVEAVRREKLRPAGQPKIELSESAEGGDLCFAAVFEIYPEVELPDFSRIKLENLTAEVTPADVEKMVATLRRQRQTFEPVERAAADGDLVNIDFSGRVDGEEFDGGKGENSGLLLGSERMIPGFEDAIRAAPPARSSVASCNFQLSTIKPNSPARMLRSKSNSMAGGRRACRKSMKTSTAVSASRTVARRLSTRKSPATWSAS